MYSMCKISVIIPTYNSAEFLKESIDSVLNQTTDDFEIIIIDDSTNEDVKNVLDSYSDDRIICVKGPHNGISAALNKGIDLSKGIYVARMDADDVCMPDRLKKESDYLDTHPEIGVCGMLAEAFFMDGRPPTIWGQERIYEMENPGIIDQLLSTPAVCHPTAMFRKEVFDRYELRYNENFRTAEDQELWIRALKYTRFHNIMEIGLRYRVHDNNTSTTKHDEGENNALQLRIELMKWLFPSGSYDAKDVRLQADYIQQIMRKEGIWISLGNEPGGPTDEEIGEPADLQFEIDADKMLTPWTEDSVPIILSSSHTYVPYLCTAMWSMVKSSDPDCKYDVYVLNSSITEEDKELVGKAVEGVQNFRITYVKVSDYLSGFKFHTRGYITEESFFRMLIPDLFRQYPKVVWIDVDTIVLRDLNELYKTDINDYCIAAVIDTDYQGCLNGGKKEIMDYMKNSLKLKDPKKYFQAGVLLFNLDKIRSDFEPLELVNTCNRRKFFYADQDALNLLLEGKVRYLDYNWNVLHYCDGWRADMILNYTPEDIRKEYLKSREDPWVIHYAGSSKPWNNPKDDFADEYWNVVWDSPFYNLIVERMIQNLIKDYPELSHFVDDYKKVNNNDRRKQYEIFEKITRETKKIDSKRDTKLYKMKKRLRHDVYYVVNCLRDFGVITTTKIVVRYFVRKIRRK